ncbi:molecular chaperone [Shewanella sp. NFH-SH190041]|uniref:molecular chaperone n=1 Tax=Shewanella sp. NFH-SH190041 TaxID=2950245 RepID=UPI0021C2A721|nr:molecular chaperone [Shewanella sp. NFH-SH190041]
MFVGFDYGSANCAIGIMDDGQVSLLPLAGNSRYLSSTLYAYDRELIAEAVYQRLSADKQEDYARSRQGQLSRAKTVRRELDLLPDDEVVFFGEAAFNAYLDMPEEGFYVRSPKSFLGASGLRQDQIALFEDIVTLMMLHIKTTAEAILAAEGKPACLTQAVIGRPVNFQGIGGEQANIQAEAILTVAATRAGFKQVAYLFEPLAAGMDFEAQLNSNKTVLVVDVGGGTTDCSVVRMGPEHMAQADRSADFLGHSGQRIGGNDLDINLAMYALMPLMGLGSTLVTGKPMPSKVFWNAVAVNDIAAQRDFASVACKKLIDDLIKDAAEKEKLRHLLRVQQHQLSYQLVRNAEAAKIALSEQLSTAVALDYVAADLGTDISRNDFVSAIAEPLGRIEQLMQAAVTNAGVTPDIVYVTGGTARSPAIYDRIAHCYPDCEIVVGDHFGSVTAGLTRWAAKLYA